MIYVSVKTVTAYLNNWILVINQTINGTSWTVPSEDSTELVCTVKVPVGHSELIKKHHENVKFRLETIDYTWQVCGDFKND